jgi:hypothetical protein
VHVGGEAGIGGTPFAAGPHQPRAVVLRGDGHAVVQHERRGHVEVAGNLGRERPEPLAAGDVPAPEARCVEADELAAAAERARHERGKRGRGSRRLPEHRARGGVEDRVERLAEHGAGGLDAVELAAALAQILDRGGVAAELFGPEEHELAVDLGHAGCELAGGVAAAVLAADKDDDVKACSKANRLHGASTV